ncbi:hypothetical protein Patl1_29613 [Pistacia atlantica]|uniref:Uncharacterized protein n=1 Tax=Pistacia atlantica TaxID=434234 RepID=A0ACC1AB55_9ROSI|nr:hypothetical protein Patl1_29613 [Pistacia atlantica]
MIMFNSDIVSVAASRWRYCLLSKISIQMFLHFWTMCIIDGSKVFTYDDVVERVAQKLNLEDASKIRLTSQRVAQKLNLEDASKIRLTSRKCYSQQPKPQPNKYHGIDHLVDMLIHCNQTSDILYYEVLGIPLPELQCLKTGKVAIHHAIKDEVELSHPAEPGLLEVFYHKIYKKLEGPEKTPAGKKGAQEATKSRSENILENQAAALELSKRLGSPSITDLRNDSLDELIESMLSEVSIFQDKVVLYAI